ncbi:hypothetical protein Pcinc_043193 [Petrolisthes cinctipes]|uniref:Uncharacterized protein n=1 Tax=Petrolisthes cinctipes TaxID=88211 RepID=A0AAE1BI24_PETCI|nr:hypothetical protein Pcinc_043193 [Petrolisthes cinctipes]
MTLITLTTNTYHALPTLPPHQYADNTHYQHLPLTANTTTTPRRRYHSLPTPTTHCQHLPLTANTTTHCQHLPLTANTTTTPRRRYHSLPTPTTHCQHYHHPLQIQPYLIITTTPCQHYHTLPTLPHPANDTIF